MKILHTSDWHLGHMLYNYDRTDEHQSMIDAMVDIVDTHKPDLMVLCGDVCDNGQPSASVQTMFVNALEKLKSAHPEMAIVVTAGNHDSPSKHDIFKAVWARFNVHTFGNVNTEDLNSHIVELDGKGYVIAVPYVNARSMPQGLYQSLLDEVEQRNTDSLPVIMMAHTTVAGSDFSGHDKTDDRIVGNIEACNIADMGTGYDYLALGHIHRKQFVHGGDGRVRYSGTPVAKTFDECYAHGVSIVEIARHGDRPTVTEVEIQPLHPLVNLPADGGFCDLEKGLELLEAFPGDSPAYLRLNVEVKDFLPPTAMQRAQQAIEGKQCSLLNINARKAVSERVASVAMTVQEFQAEAPIDIAARYAADRGLDFDDDLRELFREVVELVNNEERN